MGGTSRAPGRTLAANALVAARFLPIWFATAALAVVASFVAPDVLGKTSWSFVLPAGTVLAVAALGQMLVVMHGGIDLSTPGVISFGGNLIAGVGAGSDHRLAPAILACLGVGVAVGLANGVLVGLLRLNPLIVTLAVGQIVLAWSSKYSRDVVTNQPLVPNALATWARHKPLGVSAVFWTGAALAVLLALALRYTSAGRRFQAVGANPRAAWMSGLHVRTHVVLAYTAAGTLYAVAAALLAAVSISIDPAFGSAYLLAPIAAVVIAGASLAGGLASVSSTWLAALALTLLTQMLVVMGLSTAMQYVVFGGAIVAGMLVSGDRVAAVLGRGLRPVGPRKQAAGAGG
ncbi:MAG TPA: ABC transporter permease [Gaiellaceae bacterium]|nr:ABC transporter permease [Gaiellaceae bacterium]